MASRPKKFYTSYLDKYSHTYKTRKKKNMYLDIY